MTAPPPPPPPLPSALPPGRPGAQAPPATPAGADPTRMPLDPWVRRRLAEVAHEINSPLSAVRLQLFLHRRSLEHPTPKDLHSLDVIERNLERVQLLISSMVSGGDGRQPPRGS